MSNTVIVICGKADSGKSTFIRTFFGQEELTPSAPDGHGVGSDVHPCPIQAEVGCYNVAKRNTWKK